MPGLLESKGPGQRSSGGLSKIEGEECCTGIVKATKELR